MKTHSLRTFLLVPVLASSLFLLACATAITPEAKQAHQVFIESLPNNTRMNAEQITKLITHKPVTGKLTRGGFADPTFTFTTDGNFYASNGNGTGKWNIEKDFSGGDILVINMPSWPYPISKEVITIRNQKIAIGTWFLEN